MFPVSYPVKALNAWKLSTLQPLPMCPPCSLRVSHSGLIAGLWIKIWSSRGLCTCCPSAGLSLLSLSAWEALYSLPSRLSLSISSARKLSLIFASQTKWHCYYFKFKIYTPGTLTKLSPLTMICSCLEPNRLWRIERLLKKYLCCQDHPLEPTVSTYTDGEWSICLFIREHLVPKYLSLWIQKWLRWDTSPQGVPHPSPDPALSKRSGLWQVTSSYVKWVWSSTCITGMLRGLDGFLLVKIFRQDLAQ